MFRYVVAKICRLSYVFIWNDDGIAHSRKLSHELRYYFPSLVFKPINSPQQLLGYPISPRIMKGIILIDCDVTKLSDDGRIKDKIQDRIIKYVSKGGGLLGTHDIVYRRVRNDKFEKAFGCQTNEFRRIKGKVQYLVNMNFRNHELTQGLPDHFELSDDEIVWGNWSRDASTIYFTERERKPLVVARKYADGKIVWLNSGDKLEHLPQSIASPQKEFVILLRNAISWFTGSKAKGTHMKETLIIAHRGMPMLDRENTIGSFSKAIESGADMVEFDVRKTKDNIFVVHHDEGISGYNLCDMTFSEANKLANDLGYVMPSLDEVLELLAGSIRLDVELKEEGYEDNIIEVLLRRFTPDQFVITSFNDSSIARIKKAFPQIQVGLLLGRDKPKNIIMTRLSELFPFGRCSKAGADFVAPHYKLLKFGFVRRAQKHNKQVFVWTVDDEEQIRSCLLNSGIKAIITNRADIALSVRDRT